MAGPQAWIIYFPLSDLTNEDLLLKECDGVFPLKRRLCALAEGG